MKSHEGETMFKDEFYAWASGPVIPSVYYEFVQYQTGEMFPVAGNHTPLSKGMKESLSIVFNQTIQIDTYDLVQMTHIKGDPWDKVFRTEGSRRDQIISKKSIYEFYKNRRSITA